MNDTGQQVMLSSPTAQQRLSQGVILKNVSVVASALAEGADPNHAHVEEGISSLTPMEEAIVQDFVPGLKSMHATGGDLLRRHPHTGNTLLMVAAICGSIEAGRWLIAQGVSAKATNVQGHTALRYALEYEAVEFASMLYQECAALREASSLEALARRAMIDRNDVVLDWFLERGVDPNLADEEGRSWLMVAQRRSDSAAVALTQKLLSAGADVHFRDREGQTALHVAVNAVAPSFMMLLAAGADPDTANAKGITPRMLLARSDAENLKDRFEAWEASAKANQAINNAVQHAQRMRPL